LRHHLGVEHTAPAGHVVEAGQELTDVGHQSRVR
jgi:hypothetical protein